MTEMDATAESEAKTSTLKTRSGRALTNWEEEPSKPPRQPASTKPSRSPGVAAGPAKAPESLFGCRVCRPLFNN